MLLNRIAHFAGKFIYTYNYIIHSLTYLFIYLSTVTNIAVVCEIELLWSNKRTRYSLENNPTYIYYKTNKETIKSHHEMIVKEAKELKKSIRE